MCRVLCFPFLSLVCYFRFLHSYFFDFKGFSFSEKNLSFSTESCVMCSMAAVNVSLYFSMVQIICWSFGIRCHLTFLKHSSAKAYEWSVLQNLLLGMNSLGAFFASLRSKVSNIWYKSYSSL